MGIEIERKFLVTDESWRAAAYEMVPMVQGYLNDLAMVEGGAQRASVRIRIEGERAFLNLKSRERGHTRQEFDYPVPLDEARALLQ
ncbi:MAG: CYTH domain-containing protein, partial [Pseudoxanthomonas sp.]|nr:CYTH domain-containing protein [Pseudoxanthomonas sp.]